MQNLVTRFHVLLLSVTVAMTVVGFMRVPVDFIFAAHWSGNHADWAWPREALLAAPVIQLLLLAKFFVIGRLLTKNHFAKVQHILDPAITLMMATIAACQLGLLLTGIGSDLDFIRFTGLALGAVLVVLGIVLFEAERHTYAGLRMPWPIPSDAAWRLVHRTAGIAFGLAGIGLIALAGFDLGAGALVVGFALAFYLPTSLAAVATAVAGRH